MNRALVRSLTVHSFVSRSKETNCMFRTSKWKRGWFILIGEIFPKKPEERLKAFEGAMLERVLSINGRSVREGKDFVELFGGSGTVHALASGEES